MQELAAGKPEAIIPCRNNSHSRQFPLTSMPAQAESDVTSAAARNKVRTFLPVRCSCFTPREASFSFWECSLLAFLLAGLLSLFLCLR